MTSLSLSLTRLWPVLGLALIAAAGPLQAADAAHAAPAAAHAAAPVAAPAAAAPATATAPKAAAPEPADSASPAARAALEQLLGLNAPASAASGAAEPGLEARTTTTVREGETLDRIIRRTMGNTPFKDNLLQAAFVEANPRAYPNGSIQRLPVGTVINVPSAADLRRHLARALGPDRVAALSGGTSSAASTHGAAAAVSAARPASATAMPAPPPRPDHRGWVRFPG